MIGLLQRVRHAQVSIHDRTVAEIGTGLLVLVGIEKDDDTAKADRLLRRLLGYRVFGDDSGKMNLSLGDIQGGLLLVPQFTLAADTRKGMRPGFSGAATPEQAEQLFEYICRQAVSAYERVAYGQFGADMQVSLTNDGPVTFSLKV
ncbi:MAG: D-tyrosyl-tRNA(Tyr) deacylase [Gammaproteobacteria bacterium]|nr:D-tyrosyl-tRNA(Tyr) deacylase [Gammaproteobacteria bacterium]